MENFAGTPTVFASCAGWVDRACNGVYMTSRRMSLACARRGECAEYFGVFCLYSCACFFSVVGLKQRFYRLEAKPAVNRTPFFFGRVKASFGPLNIQFLV